MKCFKGRTITPVVMVEGYFGSFTATVFYSFAQSNLGNTEGVKSQSVIQVKQCLHVQPRFGHINIDPEKQNKIFKRKDGYWEMRRIISLFIIGHVLGHWLPVVTRGENGDMWLWRHLLCLMPPFKSSFSL